MNEFIMWNKRLKIFSQFVDEYRIGDMQESEYLVFLQYIGKTDIEGKKIYADSSVVDLNDAMGTQGYFTFKKDELRYILKVIGDSICAEVRAENWDVFKIKIVDTLQENPELLE